MNRAADTGSNVIPRRTHDWPGLPKVVETNERAERRCDCCLISMHPRSQSLHAGSILPARASAVGFTPGPCGARRTDRLRGTYAQLAAEGRKSAAAGRGWSKAEAAAHVTQMDVQVDRAKVWVNQVTTPYREGRAGEAVGPGTPFVSSHVFVFERAGDGWLLAEDATDAEHR